MIFLALDMIRDDYVFDSRTSYTVPPALEAFFESVSYEDAIRKASSIGGDSDTIACMTGVSHRPITNIFHRKYMTKGCGYWM